MTQQTFLSGLAAQLIASGTESFSRTTVILPNKRARVFLIDALRSQLAENVFAPRIISIEEFTKQISGLRVIEPVPLLFSFYDVYLECTPEEKRQDFEAFGGWAKTLLQDFNEMDRYLLAPETVFNYLQAISDIEHWAVDATKQTPLISRYLEFWNQLPAYYDGLYNRLKQQGVGYQGMIYREAVANLDHFSQASDGQRFVFAGFNALNQAEETIIQHLLATGDAEVYWDIDKVFLDDDQHDAGLFIRRFRDHWPYYRSRELKWIQSGFSDLKNIQIIGTPKAVGQAKIASKLVEHHARNDASLRRTAVVLGQEGLLLPLLHSLPAEIDALNITMGYSAKNNPVQLLISKLFRLHTAALARSPQQYVIYYKDLLDVLSHPLVAPFAEAHSLISVIKSNNYTFIPHEHMMNQAAEANAFFHLLLDKWPADQPIEVLQRLSDVLLTIKTQTGTQDNEAQLTRTFLFAIHKVINQLISYYETHTAANSLTTLFSIYKQLLDMAEVSFEGEPLEGLQIMGVLESRVLDFETVIVTSLNEGTFPAGKSQQSFIPYDVKRELGLPTYKEKDAIYTYHFYHLLQRARNVYLIYNTQSDGFDAGERSRFITQLEVAPHSSHNITFLEMAPDLPLKPSVPIRIEKTPSVMTKLKAFGERGISPSAIGTYLRNPVEFYLKYVLYVREDETVEESIAANTLGTIIHATLENLYTPYLKHEITVKDLNQCLMAADEEVKKQFKAVYREGEISKGRNLIAFEIAKRHVHNFLRLEISRIEQGETIYIEALETSLERSFEHPLLQFPVNLKGNVDRIERIFQSDGTTRMRIVDYKTGRVEARNLVLKTWEGFCTDVSQEKLIQVLMYAFLMEGDLRGQEFEAGIISFKNLRSGFLPFCLNTGNVQRHIDAAVFAKFQDALAGLLTQIFDPETPFVES